MGNYFVIFETIQPLHWSNNLDIKVVSCSGRGERLGHEIKTRRPMVVMFFLFNRNTLNNRQKISKCLKNGSDRLRKGNLRQLFIILQVNLYSLFPLLGVLHIDDIKLSNTPIFDFIPNQNGCTVDCK